MKYKMQVIKEGIEFNALKKTDAKGYDERAEIKMPKGFWDCSVYLKNKDSNDFAFQVSETHPYDMAEYVWAYAKNGIVTFVKNRKAVNIMRYGRNDDCKEVLEKVIYKMRELNSNTEPRIDKW